MVVLQLNKPASNPRYAPLLSRFMGGYATNGGDQPDIASSAVVQVNVFRAAETPARRKNRTGYITMSNGSAPDRTG